MQWHLERPAAKQGGRDHCWDKNSGKDYRKENVSGRCGWQWETSGSDGKEMKEKTLRGAVQSLLDNTRYLSQDFIFF